MDLISFLATFTKEQNMDDHDAAPALIAESGAQTDRDTGSVRAHSTPDPDLPQPENDPPAQPQPSEKPPNEIPPVEEPRAPAPPIRMD
jgi:hypothetical protein